jgi:hypothetical protein
VLAKIVRILCLQIPQRPFGDAAQESKASMDGANAPKYSRDLTYLALVVVIGIAAFFALALFRTPGMIALAVPAFSLTIFWTHWNHLL